MRRFVAFGPAAAVLVAVLVALFAMPAVVRNVTAAQTSARIVLARQALADDDILERLNRAVRNVAEVAKPSVVHIEVSGGERGWRRSSGSGWVYDASGHIITNAHVVRGADRISVQFSDGRVVETDLLRGQQFLADPFTDIAVIKVEGGDFLHAAKRSDDAPAQGDRVFAFGSPFGFKFSMSEGIVGGVGRDPQTASEFGGYTNYIQHDAAVNPGNSGGPLVDIRGRVVGMNVAIATGRDSQGTTGEGQSAGISFAIPMATIDSVVGQLLERGNVARGFMGVRWAAGRDDSVVYEPSIKRTGVKIERVEDNGPAQRAGLRSGDLITAVGGIPVTNWEVLRSVITSSRPGQPLEVEAWRDGEARTVSVILGEMPREVVLRQGRIWREFSRFGLEIIDSEDGPRIRRVQDDSPASVAGFKPDQIILEVGEIPVKTYEDVQSAAIDAGLLVGRKIALRVTDLTAGRQSPPYDLSMRLVR